MPALTAQNAVPSTLADVIGQVIDAFGAMADATPVMVGAQYLDRGVGSDARILFVPEPGGKVGPPIEMGNSVSIAHSCDVYVRAAETGDDLERLRNAYALADLVIDCIQTAATARIAWGDYEDDSPTTADAYGADLHISFSYTRDVPHNAARWALPPASADTAGARPAPPPGSPGTVDDVTPSTVPVED